LSTPTDTRGQRLAYGALIALTVAVGVVTFVLSFYGLRDYGIRVEHLSPSLASLVPLGVDILSLCGVAGTYLLRNAAARVRAYAWLVFGVAVSASVAGNITHAVAQGLSPAGMVGAAAWPVLLALAAHFVIVARRALERGTQAAQSPERPPAREVEDLAQAVPTSTLRVREASGRRALARRPDGTPPLMAQREQVRKAYASGEGIGAIAKWLNGTGPSRRTLENWTTDLREVHGQAKATAQAELVTLTGGDDG